MGTPTYLAVTGGVGGAKLGLGLSHVLSADALAFVVNTGDDFEHLGLHVSPDLDTLMYTLSGLSNPDTGWGRVNESWHFIETLRQFGGEGWFNLGDRDLAVHVRRSGLLRDGYTLGQATQALNTALGIAFRVWPMSDDPVATRVVTDAGELAFQHYFVRERCTPRVSAIRFDGADAARATPALLDYLASPDLAGVIICPSNPYLSVDPILAVPGIAAALRATAAPVVAVSPIVGGTAIKGPTAKIMAELGLEQSAATIAAHYADLVDGFILDDCDAGIAAAISHKGVRVISAPTLMTTLDDRINLAHTALGFLRTLK